MEIWLRNLTKQKDISINLPMKPEKLAELLNGDEWIIIDSPVGEELTNIPKLNEAIPEFGEDTLQMLCKTFLLSELEGKSMDDFTIIDFNAETSGWGCGYGVPCTEEYMGLLLFEHGYETLPFEYTPEMEDYIRWEIVWTTAGTEGWRHIYYNENDYLVRRW